MTLRSLSIASDAIGQPAEAEETRRSAREIEERLIREHPETKCLLLRRGPDLLELFDDARPECQRLGRPENVRRIVLLILPSACWWRPRNPAISAARRLSSD